METATILRVLMERGAIVDYAAEYGEPGYHTEKPNGIVFGDYWCRSRTCDYTETWENGTKKVHGLDVHYPRVFAQLERDTEEEWSDEWCTVEGKAYRTEPDSYTWQRSVVWNEEICDYMVNGEDIDTWLRWATNNPERCLMRASFSDAELETVGYVERQCDYESGWYGQEDNPASILEALQAREPWLDVLFKLSAVEQFRVTFCVFVRESATCRYCERDIVNVRETWCDPNATGDDAVWRETCDAHDTFLADHVPNVARVSVDNRE